MRGRTEDTTPALLLSILLPLLSLLLVVLMVPGVEGRCMSEEDPEARQPFASKTAYYDKKRPDLKKRKNDLVPSGCTATQLWHLARHGTSYPDSSQLLNFKMRLRILKEQIVQADWQGIGRLCNKDGDMMRDWHLDGLNLSRASTLADEGDEELEDLSSKYLYVLPEVLDKTYTKDAFKFRFADSPAARKSAEAYASGLFGESHKVVMPQPPLTDPLLKFYEVCSKYNREVRNNPRSMEVVDRFFDGPQMAGVLNSVTVRTGVNLTVSNLLVMYEACRYYKAWTPANFSAFCAMFTHEDLQVLEYWQDLKSYYEDGYGHVINYEQACPPLQDLITTFRRRVEDNVGPYGVFYFTHAPALLRVIARLGLYRDAEDLPSDRVVKDRAWKTSNHGTFGTNLAFVLSRCEGSTWRINLAVNERVVQLAGCDSIGCTWDQFRTHYGHYENCDFDSICENEMPVYSRINSGTVQRPATALLLALLASVAVGRHLVH